MKRSNKFFTKWIGLFNCLVLVLVALNANIACAWVFHQPEFPEAADRFKKIK